jgi:hypothetical protein
MLVSHYAGRVFEGPPRFLHGYGRYSMDHWMRTEHEKKRPMQDGPGEKATKGAKVTQSDRRGWRAAKETSLHTAPNSLDQPSLASRWRKLDARRFCFRVASGAFMSMSRLAAHVLLVLVLVLMLTLVLLLGRQSIGLLAMQSASMTMAAPQTGSARPLVQGRKGIFSCSWHSQ